jgi:ribosomal protein S12 methylthiotransferase
MSKPSSSRKGAAPSAGFSVGFVSLGCAKNLVDSQVMAGSLLEEGVTLARSPEEADVILVNTCAFIGDARDESMDAILDACRMKNEGRCRAVVVAGCLPQRYRDDLVRSLPEVDAFVGVDELDALPRIVRRIEKGETHFRMISRVSTRLFEPTTRPVVLTGGAYAYLKIAEGCDHRCAFCAIPHFRGAYRSRPIRRIVREAEMLLSKGYRELNLISQDVTAYGRDLPGKPALADLVRALGKLGGNFWIRLLYSYPSLVTDELLAAMAETPQVCRYLDTPIQHSHPDMLRAMRRADTVSAVANLARRARAVMPDVVLRTTCLIGFPGETPARFRHLVKFIEETEFDHVGAFVFSPEEGTPAARMARRPRSATAQRRREELMLAQRAIVDRKARARIGAEMPVLLERPPAENGAFWMARSQREAPEVDGDIRVRGVPAGTRVGTFVRARIRAQREYDFDAEYIGKH